MSRRPTPPAGRTLRQQWQAYCGRQIAEGAIPASYLADRPPFQPAPRPVPARAVLGALVLAAAAVVLWSILP